MPRLKLPKHKSPYVLDKKSPLSPHRFQNSEIRRKASNLQNAYEFEEFIKFVHHPTIDTRHKEFVQFRLALNLYAKFEEFNTYATADGEPVEPDTTITIKQIVRELGSKYHFNQGKYYKNKAHKKMKASRAEQESSETQITLFQKALHLASKAKEYFEESLKINEDENTKDMYIKADNFLKKLEKNYQLLPSYQEALKTTHKAHSKQTDAHENLEKTHTLSKSNKEPQPPSSFSLKKNKKKIYATEKKQYHQKKATYLDELEKAEEKFIEAALQYLNASELILDRRILEGARRSLESIYQVEAKKIKENPSYVTIKPIIREIAKRIELGFKKIQEREESSSGIGTDSSNEHYIGGKKQEK